MKSPVRNIEISQSSKSGGPIVFVYRKDDINIYHVRQDRANWLLEKLNKMNVKRSIWICSDGSAMISHRA